MSNRKLQKAAGWSLFRGGRRIPVKENREPGRERGRAGGPKNCRWLAHISIGDLQKTIWNAGYFWVADNTAMTLRRTTPPSIRRLLDGGLCFRAVVTYSSVFCTGPEVLDLDNKSKRHIFAAFSRVGLLVLILNLVVLVALIH